jgi:hypothetical protein
MTAGIWDQIQGSKFRNAIKQLFKKRNERIDEAQLKE